jgi:phosphohistidine phosphatase
MALYLVQHGKSLPKESSEDPGLSPEGIAETHRIAEVAKGYGVPVSVIRHSVKARARETAEIFAAALLPEGGLTETEGLKPTDDVTLLAESLSPADGVMLVGHLPFMGKMLSFLVTGSAGIPVFSFQNSGIVCLGRETGSSSWIIRWTLMPSIGTESP